MALCKLTRMPVQPNVQAVPSLEVGCRSCCEKESVPAESNSVDAAQNPGQVVSSLAQQHCYRVCREVAI